jgi:signal transduction histidine kinase
MPEHILKDIFAQAKRPALAALEASGDLSPLIHKWRKALQSLDLDPKERETLARLDLQAGLDRLRGIGYSSLRMQLGALATDLASSGIDVGRTLAAFYVLLDLFLAGLAGDAPSGMAVTRLHGVIAALIAAGYSSHWKAEQAYLSEAVSEARHRLHGASAYVTQVYEGERRRLSHDLHDEIGHDLMLLKLYLELLLRELSNMDPERLRGKLEETLHVVRHAIESARRLVLDLGPAIFDDLGFMPAIRSYVRQFSQRTGLKVDLHEGSLPEQVPMTHQVALYRILQGALANAFKHGGATSVKVTLGGIKGAVVLTIEDNGVGFDLSAPKRVGAVGLTAMRERAEVLGGRFHIRSVQRGALKRPSGTRIEVDLPLPKAHASVSAYKTSKRA